MFKKLLLFGVMVVLLAACSDDQVTPNDRLEDFTSKMQEETYEGLYEYLTPEAKDTYSEEDSTLRTEKIYEDLNVTDLSFEVESLSEDALDIAFEEKSASVPFHVSMETMAGPVEFDYEADLKLLGEEDEENWYIDWNPGFIFSELADGGELGISSTPPKRGEILDRNNMPLAMNGELYQIGLVPGELGENAEANKENVADLLGMSVENINETLNASWVTDDVFVPLASIMTDKEELFQDLMAIDGVTYQEITGRIYPGEEASAHLVGYIRNVNAEDLEELDPGEYSANDKIGSRGLESLYEEKLRGKKGTTIYVEQEDQENVVIAEKSVEHGENVRLTIDINTQEKLFDQFDGNPGNATAINPSTGETIALVSSPSFDPNEALYGTSENFWGDLEENELNPVLNRFSATFAPGSVIKPVTAAIGLKNGSIAYGDGIEINGLTWSNGENWGDYEVTRVSTSNGPVDIDDALIRSDNIYFAMKAVEMGTDAYVEGLQSFGIGEEFPFEYPVPDSTISSSGDLSDEVLLANSSYGQGELEMSAIHLASTYTTFLNEGNMLKPILLTDEEKSQIWKEDLITEEQANNITDSLRKVVTEGTGKAAQEADFPISGKTGTAELKLTSEDSGDENSWFVGYPTEQQDILLSLMIEGTKNHDRPTAVEVATDVFIKLNE
ncbi:penicillin-binding transpeptidase domain-containing protein [Oceanobacillus sp. 1P07AA]|uniref:penicillin-binding transpeptidase domain-containing protein n=1 Tax=Oceanobacillus sp. 1P07AA TaxID=3132293 RepID=UPI0039A68328